MQENVAYHLKELLVFVITSCVYQNNFKIAQITPFHMKGSPHDISNDKLVSGLSNLNKVFGNIIDNSLQNFCQTSNFLAHNHFGFRKNRKTELAALSLLDILIPVLECEKYATCVFLDYSACFDTLSRSVLFDKLERYGIRGVYMLRIH